MYGDTQRRLCALCLREHAAEDGEEGEQCSCDSEVRDNARSVQGQDGGTNDSHGSVMHQTSSTTRARLALSAPFVISSCTVDSA